MRNGPTGSEIHDAIEDLKNVSSGGERLTDAHFDEVAKDYGLKPELLRRKFEEQTRQRPGDYAAPKALSHEEDMKLRGQRLLSGLDPVEFGWFLGTESPPHPREEFGKFFNFQGRDLMAVVWIGDLLCLDCKTKRKVQIVWRNGRETQNELSRLRRGEPIESGRLKG